MPKRRAKSNTITVQEDTTYNGWKNRETWLVNLWLTNDRETYITIYDLVHSSEADYLAADRIKDYLDEMNPLEETASVYVDLLNTALSRVDWLEVAQAFLED